MPRRKFSGLQGNEAEQEAGSYSTYDGPLPPVGIYTVSLRNLYLTTNKNGDDYIYGFADIAEKGTKAKYNGYSLRVGQNITPQGAGYVNKMLDALEIPRKVFWTQGVVTTADEGGKGEPITKIGKVKIGDNILRVQTKKEIYEGEDRLAIATYLPAREEDEAEEYEEDDDEYEEEEPEEEPDEEDEEYDDEDEEEEPEPPKKRAAKKAPAKKAPAKKAAKAAPAKSTRRRKPEPEPDEDEYEEDEYEDEEDPF